MNDEVKLILTKLKIVSEEKESGAYICDKEHSKLLLSYIEQLGNNRDKAIEICDFYNKKYQKDPLGNQKVLFVINNIKDILKGDSDDK